MNNIQHPPQHIVDARHKPCPMPILMLKRLLKTIPDQQLILIKATDPNSQEDLRYFCQVQQLTVMEMQQIGDEFHFLIKN